MKTQTFTVTLTLSNKITSDEEIKQMASNIADALKRESKEYGLAPDDSDSYVEIIEVTPQFLPDETVRLPIL